MGALAAYLARRREGSRKRRARREARGLVREVRKAVRTHGYRIPAELRADMLADADALDRAQREHDHDGVCAGLVKLDEHVERHLSFARKSTFREYGESIGVAVLIALFLRAFVVEAFKIPSGSMIPTMEVGDHIFVNKFIYGGRIPFTKVHFFDFRAPRRGEIVVFMYPVKPDQDFIKRVVGVPGDTIEFRNRTLYVNGRAVSKRRVDHGSCQYRDYDESSGAWPLRVCEEYEEVLDGHTFRTYYTPGGGGKDLPPTKIEPGTVFVMGDNRDNSSDSRYWGPVPIENIKGRALVVWWSSNSNAGVQWSRFGKLVE